VPNKIHSQRQEGRTAVWVYLVVVIALIGGVALWGISFLGRAHEWSQVREMWKFPTGESLVSDNRLLSPGFLGRSCLKDSKLFLRWANGGQELLWTSTTRSYALNHGVVYRDSDFYAVAAGRAVFYRQRTSGSNQWNSWALTNSPETFAFIKAYLDARSPNAYGPTTNIFPPQPNAIAVKSDHPYSEYTLVVAGQGDSPYEIAEIRDGATALVAVPFAPNPYAPDLVFAGSLRSGGWKLDVEKTLAWNARKGTERTHAVP